MAQKQVERRLAAILAADVVGYSRLMAVDEEGTLARLKALRRDVLEPAIASRHGRLVKLMGDGALVEFPSVVDAVRCAVELQDRVSESNAGISEGNRIRLRIGVNIGDVIVEGTDLYGDGVNIASRLEQFAEPGGVCLSGDAQRHVRAKLDLAFEDLGAHVLKNIPEPVQIFAVRPPVVSFDAPSADADEQSERPSIAVLPFDNMSGDPAQEFMADGITEDLITALSKIRWFFVIARNSTFTYKGTAVKVAQVARDLGVRYVLEGSVRKAGSRVRVTVQLIDAASDRHVWAESYDRELEDIFALQDEMTRTIVGAVEPELSAVERERAARKPPESLDAWEIYQRALWHLWLFTKDDNARALGLFRKAQGLDDDFAPAHAFEAYVRYLAVILGYSEQPEADLAQALTAGEKALALDDKDPIAYFALGRVAMLRGAHDDSIAALETALAINPSFAQAYHGLGMVLALVGRLEEAAEALETSMRLSPRDPLLFAVETIRAFTCILQGRDEAAVAYAQKAIREPRSAGGGYWPYAALGSALGNLDRIEGAQAAIAEARRRKPGLSIAYIEQTLPTKAPGSLERYLAGLRKAGLPETAA